jgi:hypothetical protein
LSKNRFADILSTTPPPDPPPQVEAPAAPPARGKASGKVPGWEPAEVEDEPLQRLNVEIPRSLHQRLKAEALRLGRTKRDLVVALLEWALEDEG